MDHIRLESLSAPDVDTWLHSNTGGQRNTVTFAERIANGSADHLAVLKLTMNRFYENMGIYSSVRSATEQDAL